MKDKAVDFQHQMLEIRQQVTVLTDIIRSFRLSTSNLAISPVNRSYADSTSDEVLQWIQTLPQARVTRWGGMISTPDAVLQAVIRRSLTDSGCPPYILDPLMENAHERRWSQGLSTLETRQMIRRPVSYTHLTLPTNREV